MTNYTEFKNLYLLCFTDDTEEDAELLFANVLSKAKCICKKSENGVPIAMLFLMDADIVFNDIPTPFYYLYAACTHPDYRGRGIMGELLAEAKEEAVKNNKKGIFLKPANKSLFDFYSKYGFSPYFKICKITESTTDFANKFKPCIDGTSKTTMEDWYTLRKGFLAELSDGYVNFSKEILTTAADGSLSIHSHNFGFVYEMRESQLLVKEALCHKGFVNALFSAISYVAELSSATDIEIRLPIALNKELAAFEDIEQNFSVIWLSKNIENQAIAAPYHGFAFD